MSEQELDPIENEEFEIEIEDDTPPEDQGHQPMPEADDGDDDGSELTDVSDRVKKRIAKLTAEKHDARRKREAAEREAQEAAVLTQRLIQELNQARQTVNRFEVGFVEQAKGRAEAEIAQAKVDFKKAYEIGDADAMADAQDRLARLAPQHEQFSRYKPREIEPLELPHSQARQEQRHDPSQDENLQRFMTENPWFNQDQEMTAYAMGLHTQAASEDPTMVGTPEYYEAIAKKVKATFAHKLQPEQQRQRTSPVAPVTRGSPTQARKQVKLTQTQVRLAARLGLTPQQYAAELLKGNQ